MLEWEKEKEMCLPVCYVPAAISRKQKFSVPATGASCFGPPAMLRHCYRCNALDGCNPLVQRSNEGFYVQMWYCYHCTRWHEINDCAEELRRVLSASAPSWCLPYLTACKRVLTSAELTYRICGFSEPHCRTYTQWLKWHNDALYMTQEQLARVAVRHFWFAAQVHPRYELRRNMPRSPTTNATTSDSDTPD